MNFKLPLLMTSVLTMSIGFAPAMAAPDQPLHHNMKNHGLMERNHMNHGNMTGNTKTGSDTAKPLEPGQGAFATIAEIVMILTDDPKTDWSKVNINRLREHLIDMDELILRANAKTKIEKNKITFTVTGTGRTKQAIQSMVPAHAGVLARTTSWDIKGKRTKGGAILVVSSDKPDVLLNVKALGFFGVMATGAHHQAHHLAMAKGDSHMHAHP